MTKSDEIKHELWGQKDPEFLSNSKMSCLRWGNFFNLSEVKFLICKKKEILIQNIQDDDKKLCHYDS